MEAEVIVGVSKRTMVAADSFKNASNTDLDAQKDGEAMSEEEVPKGSERKTSDEKDW